MCRRKCSDDFTHCLTPFRLRHSERQVPSSLAFNPYMFTPSSLFRRRSRDFCSLAMRSELSRETSRASARGTTTTPSISATITSPGFTIAPAQWIGTLTCPGVAFTVPCAEIALDQIGKVHRREVRDVAHTSFDHESHDAVRLAGDTQQITEHSVRGFRGGRDDENVARLNELERGVNHDVVAGMAGHRDRAARLPWPRDRWAACRASSGQFGPALRGRSPRRVRQAWQ